MSFRSSTPAVWLVSAALLAAGTPGSLSAQTTVAGKPVQIADENGSLDGEIDLALKRGVGWLAAHQNARGFWSDADHPALTALALLAIGHSDPAELSRYQQALESGFEFLRAQVQPDGGVYKSALSNYNTSLSLLAFVARGEARDASIIRNARAFVVGLQARDMVRPELNGGIGYGPNAVSPKRQHPDLDNTLVALEALRASEAVDATLEKSPPAASLDWQAAIQFISRCQNLPEARAEGGGAGGSDRGGFVYYPGFSNAGEKVEADGSKALRSSGTMSYAGLLSFIYADIPRDDARIVAALDWLKANYTLKENPGLGEQGLFYYYHLMAKALTVSGVDRVASAAGTRAWKRELALELLNRQDRAGFWVNQTGRWMEKDPVLVTSYAVLTLERIRGVR